MRTLVGLCATAAALITSVVVAPAAVADPSPDPCQMAVSLFCRFIPTAPDLDHDIDLTQDQPPAAPPETFPIPDICAYGCV